jgi:hypothetical protein
VGGVGEAADVVRGGSGGGTPPTAPNAAAGQTGRIFRGGKF